MIHHIQCIEAELQVGALQVALTEAHEGQERAGALLAQRRNELSAAREQATALAHELATMRARRDTIVRRLAELDRLDLALAADKEREEALRADAETRNARRSIIGFPTTRRRRSGSDAGLPNSKPRRETRRPRLRTCSPVRQPCVPSAV